MNAKEHLEPILLALATRYEKLFKQKMPLVDMQKMIIDLYDAAPISHWENPDIMSTGAALQSVQSHLSNHDLKSDVSFASALIAQILKDVSAMKVQLLEKAKSKEAFEEGKSSVSEHSGSPDEKVASSSIPHGKQNPYASMNQAQGAEKESNQDFVEFAGIDQMEINAAIEKINGHLESLDIEIKRKLASGKFTQKNIVQFEAKQLWLTKKLKELIGIMGKNQLLSASPKGNS